MRGDLDVALEARAALGEALWRDAASGPRRRVDPAHRRLRPRPRRRQARITTRREGLTAGEVRAQPLAGSLLRLDAAVAGQPLAPFAG
jgi:hypothetical protein